MNHNQKPTELYMLNDLTIPTSVDRIETRLSCENPQRTDIEQSNHASRSERPELDSERYFPHPHTNIHILCVSERMCITRAHKARRRDGSTELGGKWVVERYSRILSCVELWNRQRYGEHKCIL